MRSHSAFAIVVDGVVLSEDKIVNEFVSECVSVLSGSISRIRPRCDIS